MFMKHALRNSLVGIVTVVGLAFISCLGGAMVTETIFNIPGLGLLMNSSISMRDFVTTQGCVLVCALFITLMNLLTEISYVFIDPRIKAQYENAGRRRRKVTVAAPAAGQEGDAAPPGELHGVEERRGLDGGGAFPERGELRVHVVRPAGHGLHGRRAQVGRHGRLDDAPCGRFDEVGVLADEKVYVRV